MANDDDIILKSLFTSEDEYTVLQLLNDFVDKIDNYYTLISNKFISIDNEFITKQDTLVSGTNIKTINGNSLLGSGNIAIGADYQSQIDALNDKISIINKGISVDDSGIVTFTKNFNVNATYYGNVDTINSKTTGNALLRMYYDNGTYRCLVGSVVRPTTILGNSTRPFYAIDGDAFNTKELALYNDLVASSTAIHQEIGQLSDELHSIIDDISVNLDSKQDKLVSGSNIKTINGNSLLGSGNITIEGGGTTSPIYALYIVIEFSDTRFGSGILYANMPIFYTTTAHSITSISELKTFLSTNYDKIRIPLTIIGVATNIAPYSAYIYYDAPDDDFSFNIYGAKISSSSLTISPYGIAESALTITSKCNLVTN